MALVYYWVIISNTKTMKNLCGKMVAGMDKPETRRANAYEVWQNDKPICIGSDCFDAGTWTWYVLKKWQADDNKEYARWFCDVVSPIVGEDGEMGDCYVEEIKRLATRIK